MWYLIVSTPDLCTLTYFQRRISRLEKERGCTVDKKESGMVVANPKVKELGRTRQIIQEISQSIKQEIHKQSNAPQDEQKYGIIQGLGDKEGFALHDSVDFIFLSFGIIGFIVEL